MKVFTSITLLCALLIVSLASVAQKPGNRLLSPVNHTLILIDHQPQMAFATKSISTQELLNNLSLISEAAKTFAVPVVLTTVASKTFSGPMLPQITSVFPNEPIIDRTTMNTWEDLNAHKAIVDKGKKKLVFSGLWTEVCIVMPVLSAIEEGYDVYFIADACGGVSKDAHDIAVQRMVQAGAQPITSMQYMLELQRDWARKATYGPVGQISQKYGGTYGIGLFYKGAMTGTTGEGH